MNIEHAFGLTLFVVLYLVGHSQLGGVEEIRKTGLEKVALCSDVFSDIGGDSAGDRLNQTDAVLSKMHPKP